MKFRLKEFLLNLNCYDYDRMTVTRLLICSLLVWQKNPNGRPESYSATHWKSVYLLSTKSALFFDLYRRIFQYITNRVFQTYSFTKLPSFARYMCWRYVLKKYGTLYFVQYGIEVEYKMDIHILFSYITSGKFNLWLFSLLIYTFTYLTCSLLKWNQNGWK